jgi:hypothetical protein
MLPSLLFLRFFALSSLLCSFLCFSALWRKSKGEAKEQSEEANKRLLPSHRLCQSEGSKVKKEQSERSKGK